MTFTSEQRDHIEKRLAALSHEYGVVIHLAEIIGKRWSYLVGRTDFDKSWMPVARLPLLHTLGAVVYGEAALEPGEESIIIEDLRMFLDAVL